MRKTLLICSLVFLFPSLAGAGPVMTFGDETLAVPKESAPGKMAVTRDSKITPFLLLGYVVFSMEGKGVVVARATPPIDNIALLNDRSQLEVLVEHITQLEAAYGGDTRVRYLAGRCAQGYFILNGSTGNVQYFKTVEEWTTFIRQERITAFP